MNALTKFGLPPLLLALAPSLALSLAIEDPYEELHPNGVVAMRGEMANGKRVDSWDFRYPNGKLKARGSYNADGVATGPWRTWRSDGTRQMHVTFEDGMAEGSWQSFDETGTKLVIDGTYFRGKAHGLFTWIYGHGKPHARCEFENGQPHGRWRLWTPKSVVLEEGQYVQGKREGEWIFHDWNEDVPEGFLVARGAFRNGLREGEWSTFAADETLLSKGNYSVGNQVGAWTWWYENGNKSLEGQFDKGEEIGTWTAWHDDGSKADRGELKAGLAEGTWKSWSREGTLLVESVLKGGLDG